MAHFRKGEHWRPAQPYWNRDWLFTEYVTKGRSAGNIATEFGVTENNILYWLLKLGIPRRSMKEIRKAKHWGAEGVRNPMYGKRGILNPNWRGGYTPARQAIYASSEWRQFAKAIRKRDKVCRLCGGTTQLEIHHIEPFSLAPLLVMFIGNAILLCNSCHKKTLGKERRWRRRLLSLPPERRLTVWR